MSQELVLQPLVYVILGLSIVILVLTFLRIFDTETKEK